LVDDLAERTGDDRATVACAPAPLTSKKIALVDRRVRARDRELDVAVDRRRHRRMQHDFGAMRRECTRRLGKPHS
jgi:hypothetical protein